MNPSNRYPETAARAPRRAVLLQIAGGLLTTLFATPTPALSQGQIQFSVGASTFTRYQVEDDGTGLRTLPLPQFSHYRVQSTTRSDYPGGRQYLYPSGNNLMVWGEESGQSKAVTNFQAPLSVSGSQWSNDGLDSFVSFFVYNSITGMRSFHRAHVSADDLASASFQPVTPGDPRLELVMDWPTNNSFFTGGITTAPGSTTPTHATRPRSGPRPWGLASLRTTTRLSSSRRWSWPSSGSARRWTR